jgi:hypothetical protein
MNTISTSFTTNGVGEWADEVSGPGREHYLTFAVRKGQHWLKLTNVKTRNDDLAVLAFMCWRGMGELHREQRLDDDYEVAGDVLDVLTDHDCELLVEAVPELGAEEPVGGMTPEATGVHTLLLDVVGQMRERWQEDTAERM